MSESRSKGRIQRGFQALSKYDKIRRVFTYFSQIILFTILASIVIWQLVDARNIPQCSEISEGNNDMYGIGIRLATYIQLFIWCVSRPLGRSNGHASLMRSLGTVNLWFLIAYITAFFLVLRDDEVQVIDLYIITIMGDGLMGTMIIPPLAPKWSYNYETMGPKLSRAVLHGCWRACTLFFWWYVVPQRLGDLPPDQCEQYGYFVVRMRLANGSSLHTLHRVGTVIDCLMYFYFFLKRTLFEIVMIAKFVLGPNIENLRQELEIQRRAAGLGRRNSSSEIHDQFKLPPAYQIFLDCLFTFPGGDFTAILYGVRNISMFHGICMVGNSHLLIWYSVPGYHIQHASLEHPRI